MQNNEFLNERLFCEIRGHIESQTSLSFLHIFAKTDKVRQLAAHLWQGSCVICEGKDKQWNVWACHPTVWIKQWQCFWIPTALNHITVILLMPIPLATQYWQITKQSQRHDFNHSHSVTGSLPAGIVYTQMEFGPSFAKFSLALFPIAALITLWMIHT